MQEFSACFNFIFFYLVPYSVQHLLLSYPLRLSVPCWLAASLSVCLCVCVQVSCTCRKMFLQAALFMFTCQVPSASLMDDALLWLFAGSWKRSCN